MTDKRKELIDSLRNINDDHDFVCGTLSNCGCSAALDKLYRFIRTANRKGDPVTQDDILLLSLIFGKEYENQKKIGCIFAV